MSNCKVIALTNQKGIVRMIKTLKNLFKQSFVS